LHRILLWKVGTELAHLKRAFSPRRDKKIYYFAFGANLSREILESRKMEVFEEFDYVLGDAALRFTKYGFFKNHGFASADPEPGEKVYGKMYLILERDARRMDYFEGVPFLKAHERIIGQAKEFDFFFYRTSRVTPGLKPTREYLDYITNAYEQMDFVPEDYLRDLKATKVLEEFFPPDEPRGRIKHFYRWPQFCWPMLIAYEQLYIKIIRHTHDKSLFQWAIRNP
jgi:hypothetical protein